MDLIKRVELFYLIRVENGVLVKACPYDTLYDAVDSLAGIRELCPDNDSVQYTISHVERRVYSDGTVQHNALFFYNKKQVIAVARYFLAATA